MRKLLLVAVILCNSSNILSTYGGKQQEGGDFKPISKAFQSAGTEGPCKRTRFFLYTQVCDFSCSETGQIMEEDCHICNDNEEYPYCYDLMCERVDNASTEYSVEDEYEDDW